MLTPTMGAPTFVDVRPRPDSECDDCPEDVRRQVEESGGKAICGWAVWERPGAYLFTEFHMVWESPSGELVDVSAKVDGETLTLFVPDSSIRHTGGRIHGARMTLSCWSISALMRLTGRRLIGLTGRTVLMTFTRLQRLPLYPLGDYLQQPRLIDVTRNSLTD